MNIFFLHYHFCQHPASASTQAKFDRWPPFRQQSAGSFPWRPALTPLLESGKPKHRACCACSQSRSESSFVCPSSRNYKNFLCMLHLASKTTRKRNGSAVACISCVACVAWKVTSVVCNSRFHTGCSQCSGWLRVRLCTFCKRSMALVECGSRSGCLQILFSFLRSSPKYFMRVSFSSFFYGRLLHVLSKTNCWLYHSDIFWTLHNQSVIYFRYQYLPRITPILIIHKWIINIYKYK